MDKWGETGDYKQGPFQAAVEPTGSGHTRGCRSDRAEYAATVLGRFQDRAGAYQV